LRRMPCPSSALQAQVARVSGCDPLRAGSAPPHQDLGCG
jgi:hypothetical protein